MHGLQVVVVCPICTEEVYEDMMDRHYAKDHDDEVVRQDEYKAELERRAKCIDTLMHEYGLGIDTIAILTGGA